MRAISNGVQQSITAHTGLDLKEQILQKVAAVSDAKKQASFMKAKQNVQGN